MIAVINKLKREQKRNPRDTDIKKAIEILESYYNAKIHERLRKGGRSE